MPKKKQITIIENCSSEEVVKRTGDMACGVLMKDMGKQFKGAVYVLAGEYEKDPNALYAMLRAMEELRMGLYARLEEAKRISDLRNSVGGNGANGKGADS